MHQGGTATPDDPNKLIRAKAGTYRTADDRFEVRQAALGWFLIDSSSTDELGQELTRGPFPTLKAVAEELPGARRTTMKPLPRPRPAAKTTPKPAAPTRQAKQKDKPAAAPKSWIDRLPDAEASAARRLIRSLTLEGIDDADALAQAAQKANEPIVARRVLERRMERLLDELPAAERDAARKLIGKVAELLAVNGTTLFDPLPGWALVEVPAGDDPPARRLVPKLPRRS
ncbi:MAG TPA: hypothetical protein VFH98_02135 [Candidatus Limnocylindria bacterium]|nr:hypothetical protein [Candidatus Limnocylindria bacterium]